MIARAAVSDAELRATMFDLPSGSAIVLSSFIEVTDRRFEVLPSTNRGDVALPVGTIERNNGGSTYFDREPPVHVLEFDEERDCFYATEDGAGRLDVVWPFGYYATSEPPMVFDFDGHDVAVPGQTVQLEGPSSRSNVDADEHCATISRWFGE